MTDLADDQIPAATIAEVPPAVLNGSTWTVTLLTAATLPTVDYLADIDPGDLAELAGVDVAAAVLTGIDGATAITVAPATFTLTDLTITGAVWSFTTPDSARADLADALAMSGRIMRMVRFADPVVVTDAASWEIACPDGTVVRQIDPDELAP